MLALFIILLACGTETNSYICTCTRVAYSANDDGSDIDTSFTESICDSPEDLESTFGVNGSLYNKVEECRAELSQLSDDYTCDCDCIYQSPCD